jgi:hypothetical protein
MNRSALVPKRYRHRIVVPSFVVLVAITIIALGWHLISNFEVHRAGYIFGVLKSGKDCGPKISSSAQERLKYYQQQGDTASFAAGLALGKKQLEETRGVTGYANTCRLFVDRYAQASETPLLIAFPLELSEFEWPFWLLVLLTAWLLLRSLVSTLHSRILPSLSTMKSWPRVIFLLCLGVSIACVAAVGLQFPPDGLQLYRGYFWTGTRQEALLPTLLLGFGPLATFIALYVPLRWVIRRATRREPERNRIGRPVDNVVAQPRPDYAREVAPQRDTVAVNVTGPLLHAGNRVHNPYHQGSGPPNIGGSRQTLVRPDEHAVLALAQRLMAAKQGLQAPNRQAALNPGVNHLAQRNAFSAKRDAPPTNQAGNPRSRRDLKGRSWRGLLENIADDDGRWSVGRRR